MKASVRTSMPADMSNPAQTTPFCMFGYGVFQAWGTMLHKTSVISPLGGADDITTAMRAVGMIARILFLTLILLNLRRVSSQGGLDASVLPIGALGGVASTFAIWLGSLTSSTLGPAMGFLGWIIWGCSSALLLFGWIYIYSQSTLRQMCLCLAYSLLMHSGTVFVLCYIPSNMSALVTAFIPVCSVFFEKKSLGNLALASKKVDSEHILMNNPTMKSLAKVFLAVVIYALIDGALVDPLATRRGIGLNANGGYMLIAPAAAGLLLCAIVSFSRKRLSVAALYRMLLPIIALSFFLLPFVQGFSLDVAGAIGSFGFELFFVFGWLIVFDIATQEGIDAIKSLLIMNIFSITGTITGSFVGAYLALFELFKDKDFLTILSLGSTLVLLVFAMLLFSTDILFKSSGVDSAKSPDASETGSPHSLPTADEIFKIKTDRICEKYKLTPREAEVFVLLARGRTNKLIQERLVISASTVDSHITHIYRKCGVHSRQEIMDFIEQEHVDIHEIAQSKGVL